MTVDGAAYDVIIDGVGFHLWREPRRPAVTSGTFGPGDATQQDLVPDVPRLWDDFSGGGGYSRYDTRVPNGISWCIGDPRQPKLFLPPGATVEIDVAGLGVTAAVPSGPFASFETPTVYMLLTTRYAIAINKTTGVASLSYSFPVGSLALGAVEFNGFWYVGLTGAFLHRYQEGVGWTVSADVSRRGLAVVSWDVAGFWAFRLVGVDDAAPHTLRVFPSDPTAPGNPMVEADWGARYAVGSSGEAIHSLAASADHAYSVKRDGVWDVDGRGYSVNVTQYWNRILDDASGFASLVHGQYVYASHASGLDRVRLGSGPNRHMPEWCQPGYGTPNETPIFGRVTALTVDAGWLVGSVSNGVDSYICYGVSRDQPGVPAGPGPILWHMALTKLAGVAVTSMRVVQMVGATWLVMGGYLTADGLTQKVYRMVVPKAATPMQTLTYPEIWAPGEDYPFASTASLTIPTDDWGDGTSLKTMHRFDFQADGLGPLASIELFVSADGGDEVRQGRSDTSPQDYFLPDDPATGYQLSQRITLSGTPENPPRLRAFRPRAKVNVEVVDIKTYRLLLGRVEGPNLGYDDRDPEILWEGLKVLQTAPPVPFRYRGHDAVVSVESPIRYQERPTLDGKGWVATADVTVSYLKRTAILDSGQTYSSDAILA